MISIIICSINKDYLRDVSENILRTIGIEYELLVWDNRHEKKGICEAYNRMAAQANFPYLCFLHEDILFETSGWGSLLAARFRDDPKVGVIGIAGSAYKSALFSGWLTADKTFDFFNITHRADGISRLMRQPMAGGAGAHPVVCIDGVFMACRREVWADILFDAQGLKGFHFYDIDFSLRAARKYGEIVTMDIDLLHITQGGDYGNSWVEIAMLYHRTHAGNLPEFLEGSLSPQQTGKTELQVARAWLDRLKTERISLRNKVRWIFRQGLHRHALLLWYPILRFMVFQPFRLYKVQHLIRKNQSPN
jgi:hypothetical protein